MMDRGRSRHRLGAFTVGWLLLAASGCAAPQSPAAAPVSSTSASNPNLTLIDQEGVRVTAPADAFDGQPPPAGLVDAPSTQEEELGLEHFAPGAHVELPENRPLQKPINIQWTVQTPPPDAAPVVLHVEDDGTLDYLVPEWHGSEVSIEARTFSSYHLAWFSPRRTITQGAVWYRSTAAGRHTPEPCPQPPSWVTVETVADLIQVCATATGEDEAKLQVRSLRDYWLQLDAGPVTTVSLQGQTEESARSLAQIAAELGREKLGLNEWLVPPGGTAELVVRRLPATLETTLVARVGYSATAMNSVTAGLSLVGLRDSASVIGIMGLCGVGELKDAFDSRIPAPISALGSSLGCLGVSAMEQLNDPEVRERVLRQLYGPGAAQLGYNDTQRLLRESPAAKTLGKVGAIVSTFERLFNVRDSLIAGVGPLSDVVEQLRTGGSASRVNVEVLGSVRALTRKDVAGGATASVSDARKATTGGQRMKHALITCFDRRLVNLCGAERDSFTLTLDNRYRQFTARLGIADDSPSTCRVDVALSSGDRTLAALQLRPGEPPQTIDFSTVGVARVTVSQVHLSPKELTTCRVVVGEPELRP